MSHLIDLVWLGRTEPIEWTHGVLHVVADPTPRSVYELVEKHVAQSAAEYSLFWDGSLGAPPDHNYIGLLIKQQSDGWHAGLQLGQAGQPGAIDFVQPTWMLNRDPALHHESTSWRLSLRACLLRTEVLRQLGGPRAEFQSLEVAALEMGHRCIQRGALMRHAPNLLFPGKYRAATAISFEDELRFVYYRFGKKWAYWALLRALLTHYGPRHQLLGAWQQMRAWERPADPLPFSRPPLAVKATEVATLTVLIPTLERYSYLRVLLDQLRHQTVLPTEVIVVDQTPAAVRDQTVTTDFDDLPLEVVYRDEPGQCSSRNVGLQHATGEYILFLDDDDEIPRELIAQHLQILQGFSVDVSSGVADEIGAGPLPEAFTLQRVSDVFPTNNTMIRRDVLTRSGLFDLAYERGQRADGDLGMRVYLSGALMMLNPAISVLHHHAPRGGLRSHKARVITYASSRSHLLHRHLPSVSEIYLARRYFSGRQVREALWMRVLGTFSLHGPRWKRLAKVIVSLVLLPDTLWQINKRYHQATVMLEEFPQIPYLKPLVAEDEHE